MRSCLGAFGRTSYRHRINTKFGYWILTNEGLSIFENIGRADMPIPDKLKAVLTQLNDTDKNE